MLARERSAAPQRLQDPGSSLEVFRGTHLKRLRVNQDPALENSADSLENRCCSNPCFLRGVILNLNQRIKGMDGAYRFVEQILSGRIRVAVRNHRAGGAPQPSKRTEGVIYRRSFITAVHHAICALGITRFGDIVFPLCSRNHLGKRISVTIMYQINGLLPYYYVV